MRIIADSRQGRVTFAISRDECAKGHLGGHITEAEAPTVTPDHVYSDTGRSPTFFECLGPVGQDIALHWLAENPRYLLRRVQCSVATDLERLRDQVESPSA